MKKYKLWILVLTALTAFCVLQVESLKATSLIHAGRFTKSNNSTSTSTTTTTPASSSSQSPSNDHLREILDELPDDDTIEVNGTKITLTGIPQIDYVWDPNLPRELNGFNLSTYPFLDSMPADEDINFDCEDKKNGFYASIKYSCQLYHHCLYGVRSDFICANFTAFDQKTFICHFVSEVDCKNSYKYWNRNDDLYKATTVKSTTTSSTVAPLFDRGFYNRTRHAFLNGVSSSTSQQQQNNNNNNNNNSPSTAVSQSNSNNHNDSPNTAANINNHRNVANNNKNNDNDDYGGRPVRPLRRPPYRRRRPIDYYYYDDDEYVDDMYDDRGRRRNRPRNRRPLYDDYDSRRPDSRRPYYDDFDDDYEYERRPLRNRNRNDDRRRGYDDRRASDSRRRPAYYDDDKKPPIDERKRNAERKPQQSEERKFPSDYDDRRLENRRRNNNNYEYDDKDVRQQTEEIVSDEKLIKPQGTSIFDRARPPPKINRPVPLSEKSKFAYNKNSEKPASSTKEDYTRDYDEIVHSSSSTTNTPKAPPPPPLLLATSPKPFFQKAKSVQTTIKATTTSSTTTPEPEYYDDEYYDTITQEPKSNMESSSIISQFNSNRNRNENYGSTTTTTAASSPDSFRLNRYRTNSGENVQHQSSSFIIDQSSTTTTTTTTKKPVQSINDFYSQTATVGGGNKKYANKQTEFDHVTHETPRANQFQNLYNNRNLENKQAQREEEVHQIAVEGEKEEKTAVKVIKRPFLPSRGGNPYKPRGLQPVGVLAQQQQQQQPLDVSISSQQQEGGGRSSENHHRITLEDLYNEEYDVDLNDALNPMLKPLTSSRGISGHNSNINQPIVNPIEKVSQQKSVHQNVAESAPVVVQADISTTTEQPEYYDDELEYVYGDEAV